MTAAGPFANGGTVGLDHAELGAAPAGLSTLNPGSAAGGFTARGGETPSRIAQSLYGDASLWYTVARANGLASDSAFAPGQAIRLPAGVMRTSYNAASLTPYDPAAAQGDTSPTAPEPPKAGGRNCGIVGQFVLAVVSFAVEAFLSSVLPVASSILGNALRSAFIAGVSSAASQAVGVATGIQEKFSWKQVVLSSIGAAVRSLNPVGGAVGAALSNAATQGIGVATGLQESFSWAGVAAAGVGSLAGGTAAIKLPGHDFVTGAQNRFNRIASQTAATLASAATRSALEGSNFGDNIINALPDVIGQTFGTALGAGFAQTLLPTDEVTGNPVNQTASVGKEDYTYVETTMGEVLTDPYGFAVQASNVPDLGIDFDIGSIFEGIVDKRPSLFSRARAGLREFGEDIATSNVVEGDGALANILFQGFGQTIVDLTQPVQTASAFLNSPFELYYGLTVIADGGIDYALGDTATAAFNLDYGRDRVIDGSYGTLGLATLGRASAFRRAAPVSSPRLASDDEFIGPLIGKSGFRTTDEFIEHVAARYQQAIDDGFLLAQRQEDLGLLSGLPETRVGSFVDDFARRDLRAFALSEGLDGSNLLRVNRRLYDPSGSGRYRIPDLNVAGHIFDATVGIKTPLTPQVIDFGLYSGGRVTVLRPSSLDGSFSALPPLARTGR